MKNLTNEDLDNFIKKIVIEKDSCWIWYGGHTGAGYGTFWAQNKQYSAHALSYYIFKGEKKPGKIIRHTCDNPTCVNPQHLIEGNQSDNALDALKRERLPNHLLNSEAVKVIRYMLKYRNYYGLSNKLAKLYKVNRKAIYKIGANLVWKHINIKKELNKKLQEMS